jgi:hypothetical protein
VFWLWVDVIIGRKCTTPTLELNQVTVVKPISTPTSPTSAVPDQPVVWIACVDLTPVMKKLRVSIQNFKDRVLAAARALVHIKIQRKCPMGKDIPMGKDDRRLGQGPNLGSCEKHLNF